MRLASFLFMAPLIAVSSGCTTARIEGTEAFARAGIQFSEVLPAVLDVSLEAKVRANSLTLEATRQLWECADEVGRPLRADALTACRSERRERLREALADDTRHLEQRVAALRGVRRHAGVLRSYFQALSSLASSDAPEEIGAATGQLVDQAFALRQQIAHTADLPDLEDVPERLAAITLGAFRSGALREALEQTESAIRAELAFQRRLLASLAAQTAADRRVLFDQRDSIEITNAFLAEAALPADWPERRLAALRRTLDLGAVEKAEQASRVLGAAFEALVQNRLDAQSLAGLIRDLDELVTLAEASARLRRSSGGAGSR
jgi:hypothetical protein